MAKYRSNVAVLNTIQAGKDIEVSFVCFGQTSQQWNILKLKNGAPVWRNKNVRQIVTLNPDVGAGIRAQKSREQNCLCSLGMRNAITLSSRQSVTRPYAGERWQIALSSWCVTLPCDGA